MTSPVSAIEAIEKAMRDHIKVDATGLSPAVVSAYVVGFDEAAKAVAEIAARQAEALQRENAVLREALKPFARHKTADGLRGPDSLLYIPDDHPLLFNGLGNDARATVTVGDIRRARALLGGSDAE